MWKEIDLSWLCSRDFTFRAEPRGEILSRQLRFEPDGSISGYSHPNEAYWELHGEKVHIFSADRVLTCVLAGQKLENGLISLSGSWIDPQRLHADTGVVHVIEEGLVSELKTDMACGERFIVLFRTHVWNAHVRMLAEHCKKFSAGGKFVVIADETNMVLDIVEFEKFSHGSDFTSIGLNKKNPSDNRYLWWNGDFPLYLASQQYPDFDYYCMIEYDALVSVYIKYIINKMNKENIDVVGFRFGDAPKDIAQELIGYFENAKSFLPCVLVTSRRAAKCFLDRRREILSQYNLNPKPGWPFCEGFLGSALYENKDLKYAPLSDFGGVSRYEFRPPHLFSENLLNVRGEFIHPVLDINRYIGSLVRYRPARFFEELSALRLELQQFGASNFVPALRDAFILQKDREGLLKLDSYIRTEGLTEEEFKVNIALGCAANQSSISQWSAESEPSAEAARAVNGVFGEAPNIHVGPEREPWWEVDLGRSFHIDRVEIVNRSDYDWLARNFKAFRLEWSQDGVTYQVIDTVGSETCPILRDGRRIIVKIRTEITARIIRIINIQGDMLTLSQVEVYERKRI